MVEVKNTVADVKNAFDDLTNRLDMAEEKIFKLRNMSIKTSKTEKHGDTKMGKKRDKIFNNYGMTTKGITYG